MKETHLLILECLPRDRRQLGLFTVTEILTVAIFAISFCYAYPEGVGNNFRILPLDFQDQEACPVPQPGLKANRTIPPPKAFKARFCSQTDQGPALPTSHGPTTTGGCTQPTQGTPLDYLAMVAEEIAFLGSTGYLLNSTLSDTET